MSQTQPRPEVKTEVLRKITAVGNRCISLEGIWHGFHFDLHVDVVFSVRDLMQEGKVVVDCMKRTIDGELYPVYRRPFHSK